MYIKKGEVVVKKIICITMFLMLSVVSAFAEDGDLDFLPGEFQGKWVVIAASKDGGQTYDPSVRGLLYGIAESTRIRAFYPKHDVYTIGAVFVGEGKESGEYAIALEDRDFYIIVKSLAGNQIEIRIGLHGGHQEVMRFIATVVR